MIEVHLIGYTADLQHLVLDLDGGARGRYRLLVDPDLFATVDQLRDERRAAGLAVGDPEEFLDEQQLAALHAHGHDHGSTDDDAPDDDEEEPATAVAVDEPPVPDPAFQADEDLLGELEEAVAPELELDPEPDHEPDPGRDPGAVPAPEPEPVSAPDPAAAAAPRPAEVDAQLTPAQIQARLRAGRSPRAVAREAGTDVTWIERWLPPIVAERDRVLDRAHAKRLERPRLGRSRDPLGQAVARNLKSRGVDLDGLVWDVGRRNDGRWRVSARFSQRGRNRTATWTYDPTADDLRPASELARELGFTRPAGRGAQGGSPTGAGGTAAANGARSRTPGATPSRSSRS